MILYYALGGGLGHLSRSFALISRAPEEIRKRTRLLVSSAHAELASPHSPCSLDRVPEQVMTDRGLYLHFLSGYLGHHDIDLMIVDSFPFGLLGELKFLAPRIPRLLVGRYLRWDAYLERCGFLEGAVWPRVALLIERQESTYRQTLERHGRIVSAPWPVSLAAGVGSGRPDQSPACCVIHSGPVGEVNLLMNKAYQVMAERGIGGLPELFTPGRGVYPVERNLLRFSDVVAGAGYGACSAAATLHGRVRFHLHPFRRRFDDQALRLRRLQEGSWGMTADGDAGTVADLLWAEVGREGTV